MSITDDLVARDNAAMAKTQQQTAAEAETYKAIDARLRAVANNAVMEAMAISGRDRFTDEDARTANTIFMILARIKPAQIHKDQIGVVAPGQSMPDGVARDIETTAMEGNGAKPMSLPQVATAPTEQLTPNVGQQQDQQQQNGTAAANTTTLDQAGQQAVAQELGQT